MSVESSIVQVTTLFSERYGMPPTGVWAAPGRVNLIGEHVDYAGGVCLPFALNQCTYVAVAPREDQRIRVCSLLPETDEVLVAECVADALGPEDIEGWVGYALGPIWALRASGTLPAEARGYDLAVVSEVPVGSGLSSSAAIECAVGSAIVELELGAEKLRDEETRRAIIAAAMRAENEVVGASTGGLDQTIAMGAEPGHALSIDFHRGETAQVPCDLDAHGLAILIVDSKAPHSLADGQYASRRGVIDAVAAFAGVSTLREIGDTQAIADAAKKWAEREDYDLDVTLRRVRHVTSEIERTLRAIELLRREDFRGFGRAMDESHNSLRDDYEVTVPQLDLIVDTAREFGALGARMTGGGFGGSAIALVQKEDVEPLARSIAEAFAAAAFDPPAFLTAIPSEGARRVA